MDFLWKHTKRYNDYSTYINGKFSQRVQKISIDAGFTCPNRDGSKSLNGCTFCNNKTFNPFYCTPEKSVTQQLDEGIAFFAKKYKAQQYLAYFQAYSNTYASLQTLKRLYEEALSHPGVIGLIIGTRPDCVNDEILDYIAQLSVNYYVVIEFGIESTHNETLKRINRGHSWEQTQNAIHESSKRGILTGGHLILGLPGENYDDILDNAGQVSGLPLNFLKLHQLQIIQGTGMEKQFASHPELFYPFSADKYIECAVDFLEILNPEIIVERFISEAPPEMIISPKWNRIKNYEIVSKIEKKLAERDSWQGKKFVP
jgi:uncharacterized protein